MERVERRQLSTGDLLVIAGALGAILVSQSAVPLLRADGDLWASAQALVGGGGARQLAAKEILRVSRALAEVELLNGSNDWPP